MNAPRCIIKRKEAADKTLFAAFRPSSAKLVPVFKAANRETEKAERLRAAAMARAVGEHVLPPLACLVLVAAAVYAPVIA